jgi:hypothetical protein
MANQDTAAEFSRFSLFSLPSWIGAVAGPRPSGAWYTPILAQYFVCSMAVMSLVSFVLTASHYNHVGIMVFLAQLALLVFSGISYRRVVIFDDEALTSSTARRIFKEVGTVGLHLLLAYLVLILARHPDVQMQLIVSILGAICLVMRILVRSMRCGARLRATGEPIA